MVQQFHNEQVNLWSIQPGHSIAEQLCIWAGTPQHPCAALRHSWIGKCSRPSNESNTTNKVYISIQAWQ